jgi:DNA polymerase-3 subunit delta'
MQFSEILGQKHIKNHLTKVQKWAEFPCTIIRWSEGSGTLAGYCLRPYILCGNQRRKLGSNEACNLKFKNIASRFTLCLSNGNYGAKKAQKY